MSNTRNKKSRKPEYMADVDRDTASMLRASELNAIVDLYFKKLNIKIIINGQHEAVRNEWIKLDEECLKILPSDPMYNENINEIMRHKRRLAGPEIAAIQADLKSDMNPDHEYVGYIYTNGESKKARHFEVVIISKDLVIKPVSWGVNNWVRSINYAIGAKPDILHTTNFPGIGNYVLPQAGAVQCGPLGVLYLKELLKNKAASLKELSMTFTDPEKDVNYFYPAPGPLRYSQSSFYNECIRAMLNDADENGQINVQFGQKKTKVTSLKTLLEKNPQQNQYLLDNFEAFKHKWIAAYDQAMQQRKDMQDKTQNQNQYLDYRSQTIKKGTRLFYVREEKADIKLKEWNKGHYYLLTYKANSPGDLSGLYYVNQNAVKQKIEGVDLQKILNMVSGYSVVFLNEQEMQELNLVQHLAHPDQPDKVSKFSFFPEEENKNEKNTQTKQVEKGEDEQSINTTGPKTK